MKTILLVEPERKIADIIAQYFQQHAAGYVIAHAQSAQDAIRLADTQTPDMVILELSIPEHNGVAFLHEFRSYADWSSVPLIIHSHLPPDNLKISEQEQRLLGIAEYLYKPSTSLAKLHRVVEEVIARE